MDPFDLWRWANAVLAVGALILLSLRLHHVWPRLSYTYRLYAEALLLFVVVVAANSIEDIVLNNNAGAGITLISLALSFVLWATLVGHRDERALIKRIKIKKESSDG